MTDAAISASLEDYLEAIFHIVRKQRAAKPKDISRFLDVGSSSVTGALKALAARDLVNYAPYDIVTLTPEGEAAAREVVRRHESLREFFTKVLAAGPELAEEAACKMEHAIPPELVERVIRFVELVDTWPQGTPGLIEAFRASMNEPGVPSWSVDPDARGPDDVHIRSDAVDDDEAKPTTMADLEPGQRGSVTKVLSAGTLRRRLMDLGLISGTPVLMERSAPLGDPLEFLVKGTHLSLRRDEAAAVQVEIES